MHVLEEGGPRARDEIICQETCYRQVQCGFDAFRIEPIAGEAQRSPQTLSPEAEECGLDLWSTPASHGGWEDLVEPPFRSTTAFMPKPLYNSTNISNCVAELRPQASKKPHDRCFCLCFYRLIKETNRRHCCRCDLRCSRRGRACLLC